MARATEMARAILHADPRRDDFAALIFDRSSQHIADSAGSVGKWVTKCEVMSRFCLDGDVAAATAFAQMLEHEVAQQPAGKAGGAQ